MVRCDRALFWRGHALSDGGIEAFACDLNVVSRARFKTKSALSVCVNDCLIKYRLSSKGAALICDQML